MKPDIRISAASSILGALALLLLPLRWIIGAMLAALAHELGHLWMIRFLGIPIMSIQVGFGGARMVTAPMDRSEELLSALAGPLFALILVPLSRWIPCTAICAAIQSCYNLLPLRDQDGGRALRCLLEYVSEKNAQRIACAAEVITVVILAAVGLAATIRFRLGLLPLICAAWIGGKSLFRKTPCKSGLQAVQ